MTPARDEPTAQSLAIIDQVLALVRECRLVLRALEQPAKRGESQSGKTERIVYVRLLTAIDDGLIRTMEDALRVLRHASQPVGPIGEEWSERQARLLKGHER